MMGNGHRFRRIRNEFPRNKGILHALMAHRDPVADGDRREFNRGAARETDARLDGFCDFIQVHVAWDDFVVGIDHADERTFQFFFGIAQRIEQRIRCGSSFDFFHLLLTTSS